jgi:hypothetical protein
MWQGYGNCQRCGPARTHSLDERTEWGTVFFIPIVPIRRERLLTCQNCGLGNKISKEDAERIVRDMPGVN